METIKNYFGNKVESVRSMTKEDYKKALLNNSIYLFMIGLFAFMVILDPTILSLRTVSTILAQSATKLFFAMGVAMIIITKGTDLSAGRIVGLVAIVSASLLQTSGVFFPGSTGWSFWLVIPIAIAIGALMSMINGLIIAKLKIDPFIATLGMSLVTYGILQWYYLSPDKAQPIGSLGTDFNEFVNGTLLSFGDLTIRNSVAYAIIGAVIMYVVWYKTKLGRDMYAIGGNREAAEVSGINTTATLLKVFAIAGAMYGFGAFLELGRVGSATTGFGMGYELDAIAAAVVGGISFNGGIGRLKGVIQGVLLFSVIAYGMTYVGWEPFLQQIIKGAIIIVAVAIDSQKYRKKK